MGRLRVFMVTKGALEREFLGGEASGSAARRGGRLCAAPARRRLRSAPREGESRTETTAGGGVMGAALVSGDEFGWSFGEEKMVLDATLLHVRAS